MLRWGWARRSLDSRGLRDPKERRRPQQRDDIGNVILLRIIGKGPSTACVMAPSDMNGDDESMSGEDSEETTSDKQESDTRDERDTGDENQQHSDPDIKLSEEGQKEVHDMIEAYKDKPTVTLPGSHGTISGTAINDWLDDEGNPKFGDPDEHPFAEASDESEGGSMEASEDGS